MENHNLMESTCYLPSNYML